LFVNTIGNHENNASGWPTYWNGSQADSTIEVTKDMVLYDFRKNIEQFANDIILASDLRKPGYDYWTNNQSGLWGHTADHIALTDEATIKIVGSHSLRAESPDSVGGFFWYPSAQNLAWDFSKIGSVNTIPTINFYARRSGAIGDLTITLETAANNWFNWSISDVLTDADEWYHVSLSIGENYNRADFEWGIVGSPSWANINYVSFTLDASSGIYVYIDDLHLSGKIVRQAYDSGNITSNNEYQRFIRNDMALDDTFKAAVDTGTAARLAKAELLRRMQTPIVGAIQIPGAVDILPGQLIRVHACQKSDGDFRINKDMRIKEIQHVFRPKPIGFRTMLNLTDDLYNAHAFGAPTATSILMEYAGALGHAEARDLKSSGIDILIPMLSKDYV